MKPEQRRLNGKVAIVTGCNSGIGKETVKDLAKLGCRVIMACRNMKEAHKAKGSFRIFHVCSFESLLIS